MNISLTSVFLIQDNRKNKRFNGFITAPSNKAIHEIAEDVARCWQRYCSITDKDPNEIKLVRLTSTPPTSLQNIEGVDYVNYHEDEEEVQEIINHLQGDQSLERYFGGEKGTRQMLLFATPTGMYGFLKKIDNPPDLMERGISFFNLLAVDEVSMLQLPDLILSGAFIREDAPDFAYWRSPSDATCPST